MATSERFTVGHETGFRHGVTFAPQSLMSGLGEADATLARHQPVSRRDPAAASAAL